MANYEDEDEDEEILYDPEEDLDMMFPDEDSKDEYNNNGYSFPDED